MIDLMAGLREFGKKSSCCGVSDPLPLRVFRDPLECSLELAHGTQGCAQGWFHIKDGLLGVNQDELRRRICRCFRDGSITVHLPPLPLGVSVIRACPILCCSL